MSSPNLYRVLVYVIGGGHEKHPKVTPLLINVSAADLQSGNYRAIAIKTATAEGLPADDPVHVVLAERLHEGVERGVSMLDIPARHAVRLNNAMLSTAPELLYSEHDINEAKWRFGLLIHKLRSEAIPPNSTARLMEALGTSPATFNRAAYGIAIEGSPAAMVDQSTLLDPDTRTSTRKAGMQIDLAFKALAAVGALEPILEFSEKAVDRIVKARKALGLGSLIVAEDSIETTRTSTTSAATSRTSMIEMYADKEKPPEG